MFIKTASKDGKFACKKFFTSPCLKKLFLSLAVGLFAFLSCRYIANIINIVDFLFGIDISYIGNTKLDRIYNYRYNTLVNIFLFFLALISFKTVYLKNAFDHLKELYTLFISVIKKKWYVFIFLFLVSISVRLLIFFTIEYYTVDSVVRILLSQNINLGYYSRAFEIFFPDINWPPLHFWMISFSYLLLRNIFIAGSIVSLFFGVLSIFPFYFLVKEIMDEQAAFFSTLLFSLYGLHAILSTAVLAEIPCLFFILSALLFFVRHQRTEKKLDLVLCTIFLNIGGMLRTETFIFVFIMALVLWVSKKGKHIFIFCVLALIIPINWLSFEYSFTGNPFYFLTQAYYVNKQPLDESITIPSFLARGLQPFSLITVYILPISMLFILTCFIYSFTKRKVRAYALIVLFIIFVYFIMNGISTIFNQERYLLIISSLILPLIFLGCKVPAEMMSKAHVKFLSKSLTLSFVFLNIILFIITLYFSITYQDPSRSIHQNIFQTVNYLKEKNPENITVFIYQDQKDIFYRDTMLFVILLREAYKTSPQSRVILLPRRDLEGIVNLVNDISLKEIKDLYPHPGGEIYLVVTPNDSFPKSCEQEGVKNYYVFECVYESEKNKIPFSKNFIDLFFRVYRIYTKNDKI